MRFSPFYLSLLFPLLCANAEDPWGTDVELLTPPPPVLIRSAEPTHITLACAMIRFHQNVISPADGPRSHYIPSSSQFTYEAMQRYGFFKGWILGCDRLMRENDDPWIYPQILSPDGFLLKSDPVQ